MTPKPLYLLMILTNQNLISLSFLSIWPKTVQIPNLESIRTDLKSVQIWLKATTYIVRFIYGAAYLYCSVF